MLSQQQVTEQLSNTIGKPGILKLSRLLKEQDFPLRDIIDITFHPDKNIAFRAAWILENLLLQKPESYIEHLNYLNSRVKDVGNPSCKRHYAKILMHITAPKAPANIKQRLAETDLEPVVEQLFDWLIDPKVLIAVKVFAAEALFNLRERYPWISEELANQIRFLMRDGTAAIQSRGRKLLAKL